MRSSFKSISLACFTLILGYFAGNFASKESAPSQTSTVLPTSEWIIKRAPYTLGYDGKQKQARWVYQHLTSASLEKDAERSACHFKQDPLIPVSLRSTHEDYTGSGFDRGHLCPAADASYSQEGMNETFYLSNISPQSPSFNRGYWQKLEAHVRALAVQSGPIHIYTGGLYLPHEESNGKRYVTYQVIGNNDIAVPTHYFKVVFEEQGALLEAYILPNEQIAAHIPLTEFRTTLEKVEKAAGIIFSMH
ncbi:MAG: DNA/RNA non-specific endonuclease [Rhabdochlamydiaceae bacterium]|nr:DNA/RNA non-specific endonuclease [Rhabdochlamydiaceae bacterium]